MVHQRNRIQIDSEQLNPIHRTQAGQQGVERGERLIAVRSRLTGGRVEKDDNVARSRNGPRERGCQVQCEVGLSVFGEDVDFGALFRRHHGRAGSYHQHRRNDKNKKSIQNRNAYFL